MSLKRKIISLLLAAAMLLSSTTVALADGDDAGLGGTSAAATSVYVNGVELISGQYLPSGGSTVQASAPQSGGYAYFDGGKLTLNDFTCACTKPYGTLQDMYIGEPKAAVFASGDLEIVLAGNSTVSAVNTEGAAAAICVDGDLTFSGGGTASFTGTTKSDESLAFGIYATGKLSFNGSGAVNVSSGRAKLNESSSAIGISCGGLTVAAGADVTAEVTGSYAATSQNYISHSIAVSSREDIFIYGKLHAVACKSGDASIGIATIYSGGNKNITISGSAEVTVESLCTASNGCRGISANGTVTLNTENPISIKMGSAETYAIESYEIICPANTTLNGGVFYEEKRIKPNAAGTPVIITCGGDAKLSFSCENGETLQDIKITQTLELPSLGSWKGYTFDGWYSAPNGEDAETSPAFTGKLTQETARSLSSSCKVYAHWKNNGKTVLTQALVLYNANIGIDKYASQGYKWEIIDGKNTLTLNCFTMENAYLGVNNVDEVIINGENRIYGRENLSDTAALVLSPIFETGTEVELSQGDSSGSLYVASSSAPVGQSATAIAIFNGSLRVNSGTVTAIGGGSEMDSCGISGTIINDGGNITAKGGNAAISHGIYGSVDNLSGTVTATGGTAKNSYGIRGSVNCVSGTVTATGGNVTVTGSSSSFNSIGIFAEGSNAAVTAGGTVKATGGDCSTAQASSYGIYGDFISTTMNQTVKVLNGGTLDAVGGSTSGTSVGIMAKNLTLDEGANFSASCKNSALYHAAAVYSHGNIGDEADIGGSAIRKDSDACVLTVYTNDLFVNMPLSFLAGSSEIIDGTQMDKATELNVKSGASLTIDSGVKFALPDIDAIINDGFIIHNGIIYLTSESLSGEELASAIARKGLSGSGLIISGTDVYLCDGSSADNAFFGDITISGNDVSPYSDEFYSYDSTRKQLTVNSGKTIVGNIILNDPDIKLLLGDDVTIIGNIMCDDEFKSTVNLDISVPTGKSAVIKGNIRYINHESSLDLKLRSGALRVNGYILCSSLVIDANSELEVSHLGLTDSNAAISCSDLTVSGTLIADNIKGEIGVRADSVLLKKGGKIKVGCSIGLLAFGGKGFTMEKYSRFEADTDDEKGIAIVVIRGSINLPDGYLPRGVAITSGSQSENILTLAPSGVSLTTGAEDVNSVTFDDHDYENIIHDVVIAYRSSGNSSKEKEFWNQVASEIAGANAESVVIAEANTFADMSVDVMEALRKNSGVSLVIKRNNGGDIIIPAGMALETEAGRVYYPLTFLAEQYAGSVLPQLGLNGEINPNTGGGIITVTAPSETSGIASEADKICAVAAGMLFLAVVCVLRNRKRNTKI